MRIQKLIGLLKEKESIGETLERLKKNNGFLNNNKIEDVGKACVQGITFQTYYGAHASIKDQDVLQAHLTDTAINWLELRLVEINDLLAEAEQSLGGII
jgi:hypothetical protein